MQRYACTSLSMLIHAYVLETEFALANDRAWNLFGHFTNDLMANKSTGEDGGTLLPIAFALKLFYHLILLDIS